MRTAAAPVVLYETKPATEWILGGPVRKMSPRYAHATLQFALAARLKSWAVERGRVGVEWRFWLAPHGADRRYLVPDVAYLSYERLGRDEREAAEEPETAPDFAAEVLSPSERAGDIAHKVRVYLRSGTAVVGIVDPARRTLRVHDRAGVRVLSAADVFEHAALPGFRLPLDAFFAELDR